jgi:hypothetical protein
MEISLWIAIPVLLIIAGVIYWLRDELGCQKNKVIALCEENSGLRIAVHKKENEISTLKLEKDTKDNLIKLYDEELRNDEEELRKYAGQMGKVVSLDLAKQLKEAGIKQESELYWYPLDNEDFELWTNGEVGGDRLAYPEICSAFLLSELLEMLPVASWELRVNGDHTTTLFWDWTSVDTVNDLKSCDAAAKLILKLKKDGLT